MSQVFECAIQARMGDVNFAGHVDNVEALRVVDEARAHFLGYRDPRTGEHSPGLMDTLEPGTLPVVGGHRLEYHHELFASLAEPYTVAIWVTHVGSASFTLDTTISHPASGPEPAVIAETTLVLHDTRTGRAIPLPDSARAALDAQRGEPLPLRPRPGA